MAEASTSLLIQRHRQSDPNAFRELVDRYHSLVFGVCLKFMRHRQDAEDATQETFTRFAKYLAKCDATRPLEPWLVAIAANRCRTLLSRRNSVSSSELVQEASICQTTQPPSETALREEVTLALSRQPANHRLAFEMFHESAMSYAEIATQLNCPIATAKTWVHRARVSLVNTLVEREVVFDRGINQANSIQGRPKSKGEPSQ